jgi:hypothetical protein
MANTLNLGTDGNWAVKKDSLLAYNSENNNFKPLPFDFSRASSATRVNKEGLIETVGSGEPRIDFKDNTKGALLLEPSRSNLITYSEDFSNAIWTNSNAATIVNPIANLSPDGVLSGNEFNEGNADARRGVYEDLTVVANTSYTLSVFVKKGTSDYLRLVIANGLDSGLDWTAIQVDLSNNSVSSKNGTNNLFTDVSSSISDTNFNGYYRLQLTAKHPTTTTLRILFGMSDGVAIASSNSIARRDYVGANKYLYVWGAMLEQSYATSYIPTSGSAVTRVADVCNNGGNEQVINSTEGVLFAEISTFSTSGSAGLISLSDATTSNRVTIELDGVNIKVRFIVGGSSIGIFNYAANITDISKIAAKFSENDFALWVNGTERVAINSGSIFSTNTLSELSFDRGDDGEDFYGNVKDVRVYNTALTDQELQALTTI